VPKDALQLKPESLAQRQLQTRSFETLDETNMLSASAAVLQDLGYTLDESETKLGVVVGSKERETDNKNQRVGMSILKGLVIAANAANGKYDPNAGRLDGVDANQKIRVALVTRPDSKQKKVAVRVTFQRQVWDMEGNLHKQETINDKELYKGFFDRLAKSVFLEANQV
jgi:hypothetical protein